MQTHPLSGHSLDSGPVALPVAEYLINEGDNRVKGEEGIQSESEKVRE